jgi:hypothetical protein
MAVWYEAGLMAEFYGKEIDGDTKCYQILRFEEDEGGGKSDLSKFIHEEYLTKQEANRKIYKLDSSAVLLD